MARKRQKAPPGSPPPNLTFIRPLLIVLGRLTNFKDDVFLDRMTVIPDTMREAGIDPDDLAKHGIPEHGWRMMGQKQKDGHEDGFVRRIYYAHRNARDKRYFPRKGEFKGMPFLTSLGPKRGHWGLTKEGVKVAKQLCGVKDSSSSTGGNLTSKFLDKRLTETGGLNGTLYTLMRAAVSVKLPLSASIDIVDDHIQNCLLKLIARDALRGRLLKGQKITNSHLATYCVRTGFTDIRKNGTEPVCREMYGARTETERVKQRQAREGDIPAITIFPTFRNNDFTTTWERDTNGVLVLNDVADKDAVDGSTFMERQRFETLWADIEARVKAKKPQAWERYVSILERVVAGCSIKDIAKQESISRHRAATLVCEARRCVRDSKADDLLAAVL